MTPEQFHRCVTDGSNAGWPSARVELEEHNGVTWVHLYPSPGNPQRYSMAIVAGVWIGLEYTEAAVRERFRVQAARVMAEHMAKAAAVGFNTGRFP